jgi:hypothetical protein
LLSKTFTTLASAQSYFADDALSLGTLAGSVNLTISTALTATSAQGVSTDYVIGSAAAPHAALTAALAKTNDALQAALRDGYMRRSGDFGRAASTPREWRQRLIESQLRR